MTRFLLAGARPPVVAHPGGRGAGGEIGLAAAAQRVAKTAAWCGWLRRWGLLAWSGLPGDRAAGVHACLIVEASDDSAAEGLAAGWRRVSGYQVTVLPLTCERAAGPATESTVET